MTQDTKTLQSIVDQHEAYLNKISEGIVEGISEGLKEGIASGVKKGVEQALKDCLAKGFTNIEDGDIRDLLGEIPEKLIKNSVEEGARQIFEESTRDYMQHLCQRLIERIQKENLNLSKEQIEDIRELVKKGERNALKKAMKGMPDNPFLKAISAGIQTALEQSMDRGFKTWEDRLQADIEKRHPNHGERNDSRR